VTEKQTRNVEKIREHITTVALSPYGRKIALELCGEIEQLQKQQQVVQKVIIEPLLTRTTQLEIENEQLKGVKP